MGVKKTKILKKPGQKAARKSEKFLGKIR